MPANQERLLAAAVVTAAVLMGLVLRLMRVVGEDFPLNDGALFVQMTQDLRANGYHLPFVTGYDQAGIPFAYPPLAFYVAGWLEDLGWPLLDVVRLAPAVVSTCTILAFHRLARAVLADRLTAAAATVAFALLPRTFVWFVMGGGLTRAPGLLFALLTLHATVRLVQGGGWRFVALAAVFGAATLCTHAENAWFAAYSALLVAVAGVRTSRVAVQVAIAGVAAAVLAAPWWAAVLAQHGVAPFLAVAHSAGYSEFFSWRPLLTFTFTDEPFLQVLAMLGLLGIFVALAERRWFLPVWLLLVFAVNPRNAATSATVPLAMLVAVAARRVVVEPLRTRAGPAVQRAVAPAAAVLLVVYGFFNAHSAAWLVPGLRVLPAPAREAMAWVAGRTPAESRFLVVDGPSPWFGLDAPSEWFPVLAHRRSVATVQAMEWLPGDVFRQRMLASDDLRLCRQQDAACLDRWAARWGQSFSHLFVVREGCSERFLDSLQSAGWRVVRDQDGFTILQRL